MEILMSVVVAIAISLITFAGKKQKGAPFEPQKLLRTVAIGLVLGLAAYFSGTTLTAENWESYVLANAGIVTVIDQAIKVGWRGIKLLRNNV